MNKITAMSLAAVLSFGTAFAQSSTNSSQHTTRTKTHKPKIPPAPPALLTDSQGKPIPTKGRHTKKKTPVFHSPLLAIPHPTENPSPSAPHRSATRNHRSGDARKTTANRSPTH